jgi:hypothetical protein
MMGVRGEYPITRRVDEPVSLSARGITDTPLHALGIRFVAGAATSVVAGVVTLVFGPRAGGIFLAFPAILAASLTLVKEQEDGHEVREDSRGAVLGGAAMLTFAAVAALTLDAAPGAVALVLASATWAAVALGGYALVWRRRGR